MFRRQIATILLLLGIPQVVWADEPEPMKIESVPVTNEDLKDTLFEILAEEGDRLRVAGRKIEAANAYLKALDVRHDSLVGGRLGVLLVDLGRPLKACGLLLDAIQHARNANDAEREGFHKAYDKAWREVTYLDVTISVAGSKLTLDGKPKNVDGDTRFFLFIMPGAHVLHASHEGYKDLVYSFNAEKGTDLPVKLVLEALPTTTAAPLEGLFKPEKRSAKIAAARKKADEPPDEPEKSTPIYGGVEGAPQAEKTRMSVEGGPVVVFGVATWAPAVGAVAGVRWRLKDYFSLGVEGRAAWLTSGIEGGQINAMTAGALGTGCLHWRWVYGCAIGHLGVINIRGDDTSYKSRSYTFVKPGFGGRLGGRLPLGRGFVLGVEFDAMGLNRRTKVVAGQTELVNHPAVMLGAQVVGAWEF